MPKNLENVCLKQDQGGDVNFRGRLFSECSWFDDETKQLVRQKLYVTEDNEQVYSIVRSAGENKSHHVYRFSVKGDNCVIVAGKNETVLPFPMLMHVVREICGLEEDEVPTLAEMEKNKAGNE